MLNAAPFHHDVASGPQGAAYWLNTEDGTRLRVALWPCWAAKGTVFILPGRTEYCEKYSRVAQGLIDRGYGALAIDWRGQGLADRVHDDPMAGHVDSFSDYQTDLAAVLNLAEQLDLPRPWHMLAHSMGGCIGLRSLMGDHPFETATFSAPMWGIALPHVMRPVANSMTAMARWLGMSHRYPPGRGGDIKIAPDQFAKNPLTTDRDSWDWMHTQISTYPALALGGPTLRWLGQALAETDDLARQPAPDIPALTLLGGQEVIVDSPRIHARMADWPKGNLHFDPALKHEFLMESPEVRDQALDRMVALITA